MELNRPIAIVGCGAIAEAYYFPTLAKFRDHKAKLWFVDPSRARLDEVALRFNLPSSHGVTTVDELPSDILGAINATPSHLHADTSLPLLAKGIGLFLEKPLAENATDAMKIVSAAGKLPVASNQTRRRFPSYRTVREYLREGKIGEVLSITWVEGDKFNWPTQSGFYFRRPWHGRRPRGCLLDTGAHIIDILCWWLDTKPEVVEASMDGYGGPEAFFSAKMQAGQVSIDVKQTFLARLSNQYTIEGSEGSITGAIRDFRWFRYRGKAGRDQLISCSGPSDRLEVAEEMMVNFCQALENKASLFVDAASVIPSLQLIDEIYEKATAPLPKFYGAWV